MKPAKKEKDSNNTQDTEVGWNLKEGSDGKCKGIYDFKVLANVDEDEDGFIKTAFTLGNVHGFNYFTDLLSGKELAVYFNRAYKSQKQDDLLEDYHVDNKLVERAYRNTLFNLTDDFNREGLVIKVGFSLPASRAVRALD